MASRISRIETHAPVGNELVLAARAHRNQMQRAFGEIGIHVGQEWFVLELEARPDSSPSELVERLGCDQPTASRTLARMEKAGLVRRSTDVRDRRTVRFRLTPRGLRLGSGILERWSALENRATASMTEVEVSELRRLLVKLRTGLETPTQGEKTDAGDGTR